MAAYDGPANASLNTSNLSRMPRDFNGKGLSTEYETAFTVASVLQIVTGSSLNGFVLLLLFLNIHLLQIPSNLILFNLALLDFLTCSLLLPYHLYMVLSGQLDAFKVHLHRVLLSFSIIANMNGAVIMTVDRYLAVFYSLRYTTLVTSSRTRCVLAISCGVAFLCAFAYFLALHYNLDGFEILYAIFNITCVVTILLLYGVIFKATRQQIRKIASQERDPRKARAVFCQKTLKSVKTTGSVVFFFLVSYLPLFITSMISWSRSLSTMSRFFAQEALVWSLSSVFWNSCANPLLYCAFSEKLRATIWATFRRFK